ncbi:MAG: DUF559 domain-containing protein [Rhodoglobus sp.]
MDLPTCLRQMIAWSDIETAVACFDVARTRFRLRDILASFDPRTEREREVLAYSRPGSDSGVESLVRQRLAQLGVEVSQQVRIASVGRVDMVVGGTTLIIEVDGEAFHSDSSAFENDRRRDAELVSLGYTVLRLTYNKVTSDWAWCERKILAALEHFTIQEG